MGAAERLGAEVLNDARAVHAGEQIAHLRRDLAQMAASDGPAADDEHDPEGTTAFERAQVRSLLRAAEHHLAEIHAARTRLVAGTYGRCEECGSAIAVERFVARPVARPVARHCIACASPRREPPPPRHE